MFVLTVSPSLDLCSLYGYDEPIPPSVHIAARGFEPNEELIRKLHASPARGVKSGQVIHIDARTSEGKKEADEAAAAAASSNKNVSKRPLRLIQWNIERGYKLPDIIKLLLAEDADIIALQEVDIGCERSEWFDCGRLIAEALHMNYIFVCEFDELYSPLRPPSSQGGGRHGNAILSRYHFQHTSIVKHVESFPWNQRGHEKKEPRVGDRYTIGTEVLTPQGPLLVYSAHFEVFAGIEARLESFREIVRDAERRILEEGGGGGSKYQVIMGDFNTLSHGIARLSRAYCTDKYRWLSLGYTESEWWIRHVFQEPSQNLQGWFEPFDAYEDVTLVNYKGWFQGKLDWVLLRYEYGTHEDTQSNENGDEGESGSHTCAREPDTHSFLHPFPFCLSGI